MSAVATCVRSVPRELNPSSGIWSRRSQVKAVLSHLWFLPAVGQGASSPLLPVLWAPEGEDTRPGGQAGAQVWKPGSHGLFCCLSRWWRYTRSKRQRSWGLADIIEASSELLHERCCMEFYSFTFHSWIKKGKRRLGIFLQGKMPVSPLWCMLRVSLFQTIPALESPTIS